MLLSNLSLTKSRLSVLSENSKFLQLNSNTFNSNHFLSKRNKTFMNKYSSIRNIIKPIQASNRLYNHSQSSRLTSISKYYLKDQKNKPNKLLLLAATVFISGILYNTYEWRFYLGALARGIVACATGFTCIMDYKIFWPGEKERLKFDEDTLKSIKSNINLRNATRVLEAMKFNGGVYIKLGQHLTALGYILPKEWTETFRPLHDRCPRSSLNDINEVLITDLGKTVDELFVEFDETPIGVASIAQVHRARLRSNDQEVAVKLQHSKVSRYSFLDLKTTTQLVKLANWLLPEFEFDWLVEEMNRNMPIEMDFTFEEENASRVQANFSDSPKYALKIPTVYWATKRVICMEFVEGAKLNDHAYMQKHAIDPNQVSREVTRIFSEMIYRHGWVHCDAHPGNLLLQASSNEKRFEIVLLDHGLYQHLNDEFRVLYAQLWKSIINRDPVKTKEYSLALGGTDATYKLITAILTGESWSSVHKTKPKLDSQSVRSKELSVQLASILPNVASLLSQVPRELIFLFKTQDLLKLVHHDLGATQDQNVQYLIMARYCSEAIYRNKLENIFRPPATHTATHTALIPVSNVFSLICSWWNYWIFRCQLKMYLTVLKFRDILILSRL